MKNGLPGKDICQWRKNNRSKEFAVLFNLQQIRYSIFLFHCMLHFFVFDYLFFLHFFCNISISRLSKRPSQPLNKNSIHNPPGIFSESIRVGWKGCGCTFENEGSIAFSRVSWKILDAHRRILGLVLRWGKVNIHKGSNGFESIWEKRSKLLKTVSLIIWDTTPGQLTCLCTN